MLQKITYILSIAICVYLLHVCAEFKQEIKAQQIIDHPEGVEADKKPFIPHLEGAW